MDFEGAKIALYLGDQLVVILRDDIDGLPFPGFWDLPGGGREGVETPQACVQRECFEELALDLTDMVFDWGRSFETGGVVHWFFVGHLPASFADEIVFGDEGQKWALMTDQRFITHAKAVPMFQDRLRLYLNGGSPRSL
ncbi:NUDIX hydrolase [Roseobacter sp. GAI101]|uniref:NUDIX hydrolase n=1 Tax=Roseobacter sp. (strain GAI101) TaxID=391589 RepID=UPI0001871767|nr:NUDIX hydrolase [Roseobacter sp. GAI101]EEB86354.1 nudix hydrolase [Roseobacter sp. GAI101]